MASGVSVQAMSVSRLRSRASLDNHRSSTARTLDFRPSNLFNERIPQ
jgi:hypothetical protein